MGHKRNYVFFVLKKHCIIMVYLELTPLIIGSTSKSHPRIESDLVPLLKGQHGGLAFGPIYLPFPASTKLEKRT